MTASPASRFELLRSLTLSGLVQEEVIRRIKVGELDSGAKLNEAELAEHLRISRSPVREAFSALEEAGLVRLEKNRGAFVRDVSDAEATELYQVRAGLDDTAGQLLAASITPDQVRELRTAIAKLEASAERGLNASFPLNIAFHDRIVEMAGNVTLLKLYRQVVDRMHLLRRRGFLRAGASAASHAEHRLIVDALDSRDPVAAGRAMRDHVAAGFERTFEVKLGQALRAAA
jgi:DNA-binding GntR family transcriptional regulator